MKQTASKTNLQKIPVRTSVNVGVPVYKRSAIAARLAGQTVRKFAEQALDARSEPILKKHGVKLPQDAQNILAAA